MGNLKKTATISFESIKDSDGWNELGHELGFDEHEIHSIFEYGEFGSFTIEVDEDLNIVGGRIHSFKPRS